MVLPLFCWILFFDTSAHIPRNNIATLFLLFYFRKKNRLEIDDNETEEFDFDGIKFMDILGGR